nr:hypothetical protein [Bradyrhizobium pachyrhizi]
MKTPVLIGHDANPQQSWHCREIGALRGTTAISSGRSLIAPLLRGTVEFDSLAAYRGFIDEIVVWLARRRIEPLGGATGLAPLERASSNLLQKV